MPTETAEVSYRQVSLLSAQTTSRRGRAPNSLGKIAQEEVWNPKPVLSEGLSNRLVLIGVFYLR